MAIDRGARVLLTGGAGFLGRCLANLLTSSGCTVRALDALTARVHPFPDRTAAEFPGELIVADVRDRADVAAAARGCAAIVHLAAEIGGGPSAESVDRYFGVNVDGTRTVLDVALRLRRPTVLVSSRVVYGRGAYVCPLHGRVFSQRCCSRAGPSRSRETDAASPISVYGETKAQAERLAAAYAERGLAVVTVRPQNLLGAGQRSDDPYSAPVSSLVQRVRRGLPLQVPAPGTQTRDFLAVEDAARGIQWLLDAPQTWKDAPVVNLGRGVPVSFRELARAVSAVAGVAPTVEFVADERLEVDHACADVSRARAIGIPAPRRSLRDAVRAVLREASEPAGPVLAPLAVPRT